MYGLTRVGFTMEEREEFRHVCSVSGVAASVEPAPFRNVIRMIDGYGDDGYGDKPADMSRIVCWFQHVAASTRDRCRSRSREQTPPVDPAMLVGLLRTPQEDDELLHGYSRRTRVCID